MITGVIIAAIIAPTILSHIWKRRTNTYFLIHKTAGKNISNDKITKTISSQKPRGLEAS